MNLKFIIQNNIFEIISNLFARSTLHLESEIGLNEFNMVCIKRTTEKFISNKKISGISIKDFK